MIAQNPIALWLTAGFACCLGFGGCKKENTSSRDKTSSNTASVQSADHDVLSTERRIEQVKVHDPAHPPIDCPLRKQGINPSHMRPFDDVEPEMVRHIHHKAMTDGVRNMEAKLIQADAQSIPSGVDLVCVCDVLHHVPNRPTWLTKVTEFMPSGARLVLIEFKEGKLSEGPPESKKSRATSSLTWLRTPTNTGLVLVSEHSKMLPYQTFLVFRKP